MTTDPRKLIDGYLDDQLSPEQQQELSDWIRSSPQNAQQFVEQSLIHDRLHDVLASGNQAALLMDAVHLPPRTLKLTLLRATPVWRAVAVAAALLVVVTALWFSVGTQNASAAVRELDRIIVSSIRSQDRTYSIVVEDISTPVTPRGSRSDVRERQRPAKPPLDGAILHVRAGNRFVLIRQTSDGVPFITGSNGVQSWAINTKGPVRVSSNIHHFDHDLPGHETSVPLTNLHEGLEQLKQSYQLQFSELGPEETEVLDTASARQLVAIKKPRERGPQRVEIVYEAKTGRILRMRFVQMPYGPDRLDLHLTLVEEKELPLDFFEHLSHHGPDRPIEMEN